LHVDLAKDATVVYAYDTRPSGPKLVAAFERGLSAFGGQGQGGNVKSINLGIQTTPVLHYVVRATNDKSGESGEATVEGYYERMASAFKTLVVRPFSFWEIVCLV
jgi:phosphoacetylglucosamine mutase